LKNEFLKRSFEDYINAVSSSAGTPGGGHVAGVVCGFAYGLMLMSLRIAVLKRNPDSKEALVLEEKLAELQKESLDCAEEDSEKFKNVMKSWKAGGDELDKAMSEAAEVSLKISEKSYELLKLIKAQELSGFRNIITDVGISAELARAAFRGGIMNCRVNILNISSKGRFEGEIKQLEENFNTDYNYLMEKLENFLAG